MIVTIVFAALTLLTVLLMFWQFAEAMRFPLHKRVPVTPVPEKGGGEKLSGSQGFAPSVTILKPLKGCDDETAGCLRSWLNQEYAGPVEILFGVAVSNDPVCDVVDELLTEKHKVKARFVLCSEQLGANAKVSTLVQLERLARNDVLIISDADVRVPPDLVQQLVLPLQDPAVGLVNCFYRFTNADNLPMRLEAFAINADFWGQVLQAQSLKPIDFALGAVMATRRTNLNNLGGFAPLLDVLADDYQLGHRIAEEGGRIALCPVVVECCNATMNWRQVWAHQVRWSRTIRVCRPISYFFSLLSNTTLWPLLWCLSDPSETIFRAVVGVLLLRMSTAFFMERKMTGASDITSFWLTLIKDLLQVAVWASGFVGNKVQWRGQQFRVLRGGKLVSVQR